jgi:hypothetical protein
VRAYIDPYGGKHTSAPLMVRCVVIDCYHRKDALKERGYSYRKDEPIAGNWGAPEPRLLGNKNTPARYRLADPCHPAWCKTIEPSRAMQEVEWLEALGAQIMGDCGETLHKWRTKHGSPPPSQTAAPPLGAVWTDQDELWLQAFLGETPR